MPGAAKTTKAKSGTVPVSEPSAPATLAQGIAKAEDFIAVAGGIERAKKLLAICEQDAKDWAQKTK